MNMPHTMYLVVTSYPALGIGSSDITSDRDEAYEQFEAAVKDDQPVAVWRIATYGSLPVNISDATDEFEHRMQEACIQLRLDWQAVTRFHAAPIAAE